MGIRRGLYGDGPSTTNDPTTPSASYRRFVLQVARSPLFTAALHGYLKAGKRLTKEQGTDLYELDLQGRNFLQVALAGGHRTFVYGMIPLVLHSGMNKSLHALLNAHNLTNMPGEGGSMLSYTAAGAVAIAEVLASLGVGSLFYMGCGNGYEALVASLLLKRVTAIELNELAALVWDRLASVLRASNPKLLAFLTTRIRLERQNLFDVVGVDSLAVFSSHVDGRLIELAIWWFALHGPVKYLATFAAQQDGAGLTKAVLGRLGFEVVTSVQVSLSGSGEGKAVRIVELPQDKKRAALVFIFGARKTVSPVKFLSLYCGRFTFIRARPITRGPFALPRPASSCLPFSTPSFSPPSSLFFSFIACCSGGWRAFGPE